MPIIINPIAKYLLVRFLSDAATISDISLEWIFAKSFWYFVVFLDVFLLAFVVLLFPFIFL